MKLLRVFPTTDRADEHVQARALEGATGPIASMHGLVATTWRNLQESLLEPALLGKRRLGKAAKSLAVQASLQGADGGPYAPVLEKRGFRKALESFFDEVAAGGATFDELFKSADHLPRGLSERVAKLASFGRSYRRLLDDKGLADPAFALVEALRAGAALPGVEAIEISDIVDWPPDRLAVLRALAQVMPVTVELPYSDRPELAEALDPAFKALESLGEGIELRQRPLGTTDATVEAFDAADMSNEVREIARRVERLLAEGLSPDSIAIAAQGMGDLSPALSAALAERSIPARDRQGDRLSDTAIVKLALELARLDAPGETTVDRIAAIVGSTLVDLRLISKEAPRPGVMARHLREAAIRDRTPGPDGLDGFRSRLERLARADEKGTERILATADAIDALFARLDRWPRVATFNAHGRALTRLLESLKVPNRLRFLGFSDAPGSPSERAQASALAREQAAWGRLATVTAELADAAHAIGRDRLTITRSEFATWLEERCSAEPIRPGHARGASVELVELGDLAGRTFDHVFIAGAYDGRLPGPADHDPLLTDDERWKLNQSFGRAVFRVAPSGVLASPLPARQLLQAVSFALAAESARVGLTISRPRSDERGRPHAPSSLLALLPPLTSQRIPFRPLDPRLGERRSPSIAARARIEQERIDAFHHRTPSIYAGSVSAAEPVLAPLRAGSPGRPMSTTDVEKAANCSFHYFGEKVLKVREGREGTDEVDTMTLGNLSHLAAEKAVRAIVDAGLWKPSTSEAAIRLGLDAAAAALDEAALRSVVGHPDLWAITRAKVLSRLHRLLALELARAVSTPRHLELAFGKDLALPPLGVGGLMVSGKFDRVDVGPMVDVLDYKSRSTDSSQGRQGKLLASELQLPIYVAAARRLLPETAGKPIDATFVSLRDGDRSKTVMTALELNVDELLEKLDAAVAELAGRLRSGNYAPAPKSCEHCKLRPVCRIPAPELPT